MMPEDFDMAAARRSFAELVLAEDSGATPLPEQPGSPGGYRDLLERRDVLASALEHFFNRWDAWLCPVAPVPAFPHCPRGTPLRVDNQDVPYRCGVSDCAPFSVTGHPTLVAPLTLSRDGLPEFEAPSGY